MVGHQRSLSPDSGVSGDCRLIESSRSRKSALPVTGRNLYVVPFNQPAIESVVEAAKETAPINALSTLLIKGTQLRGEKTQVFVSGFDLTAGVTELRQTQITLPLPGALPAGMRAGIQTVQVVQTRDMGTPEVPHAGVESNAEAFVLRPIIATNAPTGVTNAVVDGVNVRSASSKSISIELGKAEAAAQSIKSTAEDTGAVLQLKRRGQ